MPGCAEAQMRCVGAPPHSAPCAQMVLPTAQLTETQIYAKLMPCCRSMRISAMHCSMQHSVQSTAAWGTAAHRASLSARRCFVTIHIAATGATAPAVSHARWFLTANPALAPPALMQSAFAPALLLCPAFWTYPPALSPYAQPHLHGLRAPPVA
jgi:hypothetical protein